MYLFTEQNDIYSELEDVELDFEVVDRKIEHREQIRHKKTRPSRIKTLSEKPVANSFPKIN
jgi:hypothetical protein